MRHNLNQYYNILRVVVVFVGMVLFGRLLWMQLHADEYKEKAKRNNIAEVVVYPMRGEILDRNGEYIVKSRVCYDVMITYRELPKEGFDTARLISVLDITPENFAKNLKKASQNPRVATLVANYLPQDNKLRLDEMIYQASPHASVPHVSILARWAATFLVMSARLTTHS